MGQGGTVEVQCSNHFILEGEESKQRLVKDIRFLGRRVVLMFKTRLTGTDPLRHQV